MIQEQIPSPCL